MRSIARATAILVAIALAAYASWRIGSDPDPDPDPDPSRPTAEPKTVATPRHEGRPESVPAPRRPSPNAPELPAPPGPAAQDDAPPSRLGGSLDPEAGTKAQAVYDDAMRELEALEDPSREEVGEIYMRAASALERVEDELDPMDEQGWAQYRADLEALRDRARELTPSQ